MVTPTPTTVQVKIQLRGDTAANWASVNPVLLTNELGLETDTKKIKVGDGTTAWNSLAYFPSIVTGGTVLGNLEIGTTGTLTFEGSSADNFETTLGVINPTADRTINLPNVSGTVITTGDTGTVTSTMIADGTIVDADVSASAAIAHSKLATITAGYVLIGNASNVPTATEVTGDVTISSTGVTSISSGVVVDADISATAEIAVSKLADGAARQLLQTDTAGTGVEWTDNVDVPGTLDVTSDATFDANVTIEGDLTVNGTTTTIDTETLLVKDKNIELAVVDTPTDTTADGGGITLKGATDKTITWSDATAAWTLSEHVDLASGKEYRINGAKVLDATSLGSSVMITSDNITNGTIVDEDINASAAIAGSKIDPDFGSQTGALTLPVGDTSERPGSPAAGMIRYNTDGDYVEYYDEGGTQWTPVGFSGQVYATGGTITEITQGGVSYRVHSFTSTGTSSFTVLRGGLVEYLVIGGGGGALKGGGGAGGYRCSVPGENSGGGASAEDPLFVTPQVYTITVGAGGTTATGTANDGGNSIFSTITAIGGGQGGGADGFPGGSGGGGGESSSAIRYGGAGTTGQGYAGGSNAITSSPFPTGGGGGASEVGQNGQSSTQSGKGGDGVTSSITGSAVTRGGGGGGGIRSGGTAGAGGAGGGGAGVAGSTVGNAGTANTGGGGGGHGLANPNGTGGAGGSGIVIIRYRIS